MNIYSLIFLSLLLAGCAGASNGSAPERPVSAGIDWFKWTADLQAQGNMRTDRGASEPLPSADDLATSFRLIVFGEGSGELARTDGPNGPMRPMLRRQRHPLVYAVRSVPEDARLEAKIASYTQRLSKVTGHPIRAVRARGDKATLLILHAPDAVMKDIVTADATLAGDAFPVPSHFKKSLRRYMAGWRTWPSPCAVYSRYAVRNTERRQLGEPMIGVVLIRTEIPEALLDSCIEEELGHVMGVLADNEDAAASIFDDGQEHALLTRQDELILRMLYDPRLHLGMTPEVAMPIVREIARDLLAPE